MFNWIMKPKVLCSNDYLEELRKRVDFLEERVKKLELKSQVKESGMLKIYNPSPDSPKHGKGRKMTLEEVNSIEADYLNGWKCKQVCEKYGISSATFYNITAGKHKLQEKKNV